MSVAGSEFPVAGKSNNLRFGAVTALGIYAVAVPHKPNFSTAGRMALVMLATFLLMAASLALRGDARPAALMFGCALWCLYLAVRDVGV